MVGSPLAERQLVDVFDNAPARAAWGKLDALATMIEHERTTYEQWLGQPAVVLQSLQSRFQVERCSMSWGKLRFVGRKAGA